MLKNLLILDLLRIERSQINYIYKELSESEISALLEGEILEVQFRHHIFSDNEVNIFLDIDKIKQAKRKVNYLLLQCQEKGIKILSYFDKGYPSVLKQIHNPPMFLYLLGNDELLYRDKTISCVGTRNPTSNAIKDVNNIVEGLVKEDFIILSGLAYGIDIQAHKVCLDRNGKTIAVLAHGLDTIYPKQHVKIAETIVKEGGLLISEYPPGTPIRKESFVARNRIVSGLSKGVIVFEANENSGTMHTARFAYKQGRRIFCPVERDEGEQLSSGVMKLLSSNSAFPIKKAQDIIEYLGYKSSKTKMVIKEKNGLKNQYCDIIKTMSAEINDSDIEKMTKGKSKKRTIDINFEIYEEIKTYAHNNNLTIKQVVNLLLYGFIKQRGEKSE